jgi:hypothetical protein
MTDIAPAPAPNPGNPAPAPAPTPAPNTPPTNSAPPAPNPASAPPPASDGKPADAPKPSWRDDWRQALAGEDEKALKRLERFSEPGDIWKSFRNLEAKMSSGEIKNNVPFPDKGSPEEQTAWRKENGIPADYTGYWGSMKFDNGLVIGEEDKSLVNAFLKDVAHAKNWTADKAKDAIAWHYANQERVQKETAERDNTHRTEAENALREVWVGGDYQKNIGALTNFINRLPESVRDVVKNARGGDGRALLNNADFVKGIVAFERDINPMHTVVPNSANPTQAIATEKATLEKAMSDTRGPYWKGPLIEKNGIRDTEMAHRYRELVEAEHKMSKRTAA